jgi:hypothetical protein
MARRTARIVGALLLVTSAVLFSRASYGPLGDPAYPGRPCVADRCPHNGSVLLAGAVGAFLAAARQGRGRG